MVWDWGWSHKCPWKAISQVFLGIFPLYLYCGREWGENPIVGRFMMGRATFLSLQFAGLYRVTSMRNLNISEVHGGSHLFFWNLVYVAISMI